jgi:hypothetical protein
MRRIWMGAAVVALSIIEASGQAGRSGDWMTSGNDVQRSSWVRSDARISAASLAKPGFEFLWKMKLDQAQRPTEPILMDRIIGYKGFRTLAFVGGAADRVYVMDTDLARMEWETQLGGGVKSTAAGNCPGGMTSALARPTTAAIPSSPGGFAGGGRGGPAKSEVGEPGEGAVILSRVSAPRAPRPGLVKPSGRATRAARPGSPLLADGPFGRGITSVYAVSSDGMLRILNVQNGALVGEAYAFVPPNSRAGGLMVVDGIAYATTEGSCGREDGVWMVDTHTGERAQWTTSVGVAGPAVMGPDGTLYVATRAGGLVALEPQTLKQRAVYPAQGFAASAVLFQHQQKTVLAAAAKDGSIHLVDAVTMTAAGSKSDSAGVVTSLASWQDRAGVRWILSTTADSVVAWKLEEREGRAVVARGWSSRAGSPVRPLIFSDVVFVASGKTPLLQAMDGVSGKELWNSGKTITAASPATALSGGGGQVYLSTYEGMLYAFGFPMEH